MHSRIKRTLHFWLSVPGALFFLLWIVSGIALVLDSITGGLHAFPKQKRNQDLRHLQLSIDKLLKQNQEPVSDLSLFFVGEQSYAQISTPQKSFLVDANTGKILSPLNQDSALLLLTGIGGMKAVNVRRITDRSYEYKYGELPAWRAEYPDGRIIHISESTGSVQSWTNRRGMLVRALYFYGRAFQFTESAKINAAIAFFAILWALASVCTGLFLYKKRKTAASVLILFAFLIPLDMEASSPDRIVSLAPSCTEIIAGLGLHEKLVGITSHTDYPPEILNLPVVGSYVDLNLEAIVSLKPDLVVGTSDGNPPAILQRLRVLSIALEVLNLTSYRNIQSSILQLGKTVGRQTEAEKLVFQMQHVSDCISKKKDGKKRPSILFVYESYPIVTAGGGTFTDELIEMAGGRSITHEVSISYPRLTIENVIASNPEVIIESRMDPNFEKQSKLEWWKQYPTIRAVKEKRVYVLPSKNLDRPSQRIVYGFQQLARTLHPESFMADTCLEPKP